MTTKRIIKAGLLLAILCIAGCFSISFGENIKVSIQLLIVLIIFGLTEHLLDKLIIVGSYLLLGLFMPIYAGFVSGISPTFGFVIGFLISAIPFHLIYKIPLKHKIINYIIASLVLTSVVYLCGSVFLSLYLDLPYFSSLLISVVPYLPFDVAKLVLAYFIIKILTPISKI